MNHIIFLKKIFLLIALSTLSVLLHAEGFCYGTFVATPRGYVPIEHLTVDDTILGYDIETDSLYKVSINHINHTTIDQSVCIRVGGLFLYVAKDQLLHVANKFGFRPAHTVEAHDYILQPNNRAVRVDAVTVIDQETDVVALSVNYPNTFCVTQHKLIIHNFFPAIAAGVSIAFGAGVEITGFIAGGITIFGTWLGFNAYKKHKSKVHVEPIITPTASYSGGNPNDPNDQKRKRDEERENHRPLTNKEARQKAEVLGYTEDNNPPFNPHGKIVFRKGNKWISPDKDGHKGGIWKMFDSAGNRTTWNVDLTKIIGK
jgi:Novel toxin 21